MKPVISSLNAMVAAAIVLGAAHSGSATEPYTPPATASPTQQATPTPKPVSKNEAKGEGHDHSERPLTRCPHWLWDPVLDDDSEQRHPHRDVYDECDPPKPTPKPASRAIQAAAPTHARDNESHNQGESRHGW